MMLYQHVEQEFTKAPFVNFFHKDIFMSQYDMLNFNSHLYIWQLNWDDTSHIWTYDIQVNGQLDLHEHSSVQYAKITELTWLSSEWTCHCLAKQITEIMKYGIIEQNSYVTDSSYTTFEYKILAHGILCLNKPWC